MIKAGKIDPEQSFDTDRLILKPLLPEHARELFPALQDARLYRLIPGEPPATVEALEAQYRRWAERKSADGYEVWFNHVVLCRETGRAVGTLQATVTSDGKASIAYQTFSESIGQGFAREACRALTEYLVHADLAVEALVDTRNFGSQRLLEAIGFARVETINEADYFKGEVSHEYRYALPTHT